MPAQAVPEANTNTATTPSAFDVLVMDMVRPFRRFTQPNEDESKQSRNAQGAGLRRSPRARRRERTEPRRVCTRELSRKPHLARCVGWRATSDGRVGKGTNAKTKTRPGRVLEREPTDPPTCVAGLEPAAPSDLTTLTWASAQMFPRPFRSQH